MGLATLWESYVFKKRYIMAYAASTGVPVGVECSSMTDLNLTPLLDGQDQRLAGHLYARKNDPAWVFFSAWDRGQLLGYSFLHIPQSEEWNDSLPTFPGEARICSNFVYPEFCGRGVRGDIYKKQCQYASERGLKLWSVIEQSNTSSIRAEKKTGKIRRKNYLVKFIGRNVLSILTEPFKLYLLIGVRRAKR